MSAEILMSPHLDFLSPPQKCDGPRPVRTLRRGAAAFALGVLAGLGACSDPTTPITIDETRVVDKPDSRVTGPVSSEERFTPLSVLRQRAAKAQNPGSDERGPAPFTWQTPEGWSEVPPRSSLRVADFSMDRDPDLECYVVAMRGDGGGLLANVNRWRGQVGAAPVDEAALADLPKRTLFRTPAPLVEVSGDYSNMGAPTIPNAKLVGLIHSLPAFTLFVKLTGPAEAVDAEMEAFFEFCANLDIEGPPSGGQGPHGGAGGDPHGGAPTAGGPVAGGNWQVPEAWSQTAPKPMRLVNFQLEGGGECYVSVLGGGGGGALANVNRWLGQIGKPAIGESELASLPRVSMLGKEGMLVEGSGDFEGMGAASAADQGLMAAMVELPDRAVFVKMVGPAEVVSAHREAFLAFAQSLTEEDV